MNFEVRLQGFLWQDDFHLQADNILCLRTPVNGTYMDAFQSVEVGEMERHLYWKGSRKDPCPIILTFD